MRLDTIAFSTGGNMPWPADEQRNTDTAFPGSALFTTERRIASIRPKQEFVPVVSRVDNYGVVRHTQIIQLFEKRPNLLVVLDHLGTIHVRLRATLIDRHLDVFLLRMRPDVGGRRVEPHEEWLAVLTLPVEVVERFG